MKALKVSKMSKKPKKITNKPDFKTLIPSYSDSELINILKKRNHYQPEAVACAVEEAIKRGIINSEHDILAEEFRTTPLKNTLFPVIENEIQRKKISKSIIRGLIISGIIPGISGIIQFFDGNPAESLPLITGSIIWFVLSVMLYFKVKHSNIRTLLVFVLISMIYIVKLLIEKDSLDVIDFFIPIVFYSLLVYGLIFLKKIN